METRSWKSSEGDQRPVPDDHGLIDGGTLIGIEQVTARAYRNGPAFFVESSGKPGKFYMVRDGSCTCDGYLYRQRCNHIDHLVKDGFLIVDVTDMSYRAVEGRPIRVVADDIVAGAKLVGKNATEHEKRLAAQVVRLQHVYRAQARVADAQRKLLHAIKIQNTRMIGHTAKAADQEIQNLDRMVKALPGGDLVELDIS